MTARLLIASSVVWVLAIGGCGGADGPRRATRTTDQRPASCRDHPGACSTAASTRYPPSEVPKLSARQRRLLREVAQLAIALRRLDSQAPAAQVAGMHRIAARLRHFERLLEDVTAGQLTNVAEDLVIEARHPRDLGALLRAQARWLLRFSSRPDRFMAARGISHFTQFPTSAGRYSFTSQWHGVVDRCDVTVAAGSLSGAPEFGNDRSTTGVVLTDSFAGCPANTGVPLKHRSGQGRGWLRPHSGALRIVRDHGSWLEIAAAHGQAFKLSLVSGRLTAIRRRP